MKTIMYGSALRFLAVAGGCALTILLGTVSSGFAKSTSDTLTPASAEAPDSSQLVAAILISRHGNRSPLKDPATLNRETSNTWPAWNVEPGHLTPRGRKLMVNMGGFYREKFARDGLLSGNDTEDAKRAYFHTNTIQRTIQSGCGLAEGLFPSTTTTVHYLVNKKDALYYGGPIDSAMERAAIHGRIGDDPTALADSMTPQFDLVEKALARPGLYGRTLSSISLAAGMADNFMCQFCEGLPMQQVAFGRATPSELREMLKILALDFDLKVRTPYLARTRMSNLLSHMISTFEQISSGKPVDGAFGDQDDRLFVIVGHDTTLSSVAGLLRLDWVLPDTGRNLCPPGGAIVFELRKRAPGQASAMEQHFVRVYYAAQTLAQMHEGAKLSLDSPPSLAPIFVPGASQPTDRYDAPMEDFVSVAKRAIDPALVYPVDDGTENQDKR